MDDVHRNVRSPQLGQIVADHDHRCPAGSVLFEQIHHPGDTGLIEPGQRLVPDDQIGLVQQAPRDRDALGHPPAEPTNLDDSFPADADGVKTGLDPLGQSIETVEAGRKGQIFHRGQVAVQEGLMAEIAKSASGAGGPPRIVPEDPDLPPVGSEQADRQTSHRRLAGPIGSHDEMHRTGADLQGELGDGDSGTESSGHLLEVEGRGFRHRDPRI